MEENMDFAGFGSACIWNIEEAVVTKVATWVSLLIALVHSIQISEEVPIQRSIVGTHEVIHVISSEVPSTVHHASTSESAILLWVCWSVWQRIRIDMAPRLGLDPDISAVLLEPC